jgi:hypothetical protein
VTRGMRDHEAGFASMATAGSDAAGLEDGNRPATVTLGQTGDSDRRFRSPEDLPRPGLRARYLAVILPHGPRERREQAHRDDEGPVNGLAGAQARLVTHTRRSPSSRCRTDSAFIRGRRTKRS